MDLLWSKPAAARACHPVRLPGRQGPRHPPVGPLHERGDRQFRQRLDDDVRSHRRLPWLSAFGLGRKDADMIRILETLQWRAAMNAKELQGRTPWPFLVAPF